MAEQTDIWNVESLKESVDQRFEDNQKAIDTALLSQEKAVSAALIEKEKAIIKAEIATEKRFDTVNDAIAKVTGLSADLMPKAEYVANHKALDDKIEVINTTLNKTSGERNLYATHADVAAAVEGITSTIRPIIEYVQRQQGQVKGSELTIGKIYAALAAFATILGIVTYAAGQLSK